MAEPFPRGTAEILGIYGGSARGKSPVKEFKCNINQIPSMFFDYRCKKRGQLTFGVFIDDVDTKDTGGTGMDEVGGVRPFNFWVPQKVRTPGEHSVVIKTGHAETDPDRIVWDREDRFTLTLTGKKSED